MHRAYTLIQIFGMDNDGERIIDAPESGSQETVRRWTEYERYVKY